MRNQKSFILSFLLVGLFAFSSFANSSYEGPKVTLQKQFQKHLKNFDIDQIDGDSQKVYIDFMINDKAEIMVLSTSSADLDRSIKSRLNYKTVEAGDLEFNTKYTIAITFSKK
ncbi:MAG: hypothetical protein HKO66_03195 [Saprospiraceae bacterium]|nr:hypothetical protein [Bacteroidia bacterium]NNE13771.1 hypothetical protein [Saprospiraceae bacterium]NNL91220.1 hypothetical protein [Saprospiraceae bacterium]